MEDNLDLCNWRTRTLNSYQINVLSMYLSFLFYIDMSFRCFFPQPLGPPVPPVEAAARSQQHDAIQEQIGQERRGSQVQVPWVCKWSSWWVCKLGIPKNGHRVVKNPISQWLVAEMFFFLCSVFVGVHGVFSFDFKIGQFMLNTLPSVEEVLAHGTFSIFHQIPCARAHQPNTNNRKERA